MQLINQQRYKLVVADEQDEVSRGIAELNIPASSNNDNGDDHTSEKDYDDATSYIRDYLEREWSDDSQTSETESESENEEDNWTPPQSPIPVSFELNDEYDDPINEDELQELLTVLDNIIRTNPNLLDDPRPVIDLDIYKYGSFVTGSDELVWEFEYCIHEDPIHGYAAG